MTLIDGARHLGGPPSASCSYPQEGVVPDSGPYLRESVWASKTDTTVNTDTNVCAAWSNHILYFMGGYLYESNHRGQGNREAEDAVIVCGDVCYSMLLYLLFLLQLTAACLAGTVMIVVSTGWLLGNDYLTVLCLHWITQWVMCVSRWTEKYSRLPTNVSCAGHPECPAPETHSWLCQYQL